MAKAEQPPSRPHKQTNQNRSNIDLEIISADMSTMKEIIYSAIFVLQKNVKFGSFTTN